MKHSETERPWKNWELQKAISPKTLLLLLLVVVLLTFSAKNTEMDKAAIETGGIALHFLGIKDSKVVNGAMNFVAEAFPFQIEDRVEIDRIDNFDPNNLPVFSRVEVVIESEYDTLTDTTEQVETRYLTHSFGYVIKAGKKMIETIEMGFWGTFISILISLPLGILASKNYTPNRFVYNVIRMQLSLHRALPEIIVALFLVLMYGFGPIPGVLALAIHTSGVLAKFFADEIENSDPGPQGALRSTGASRIKVLRIAVFPQVFPAFVAYVQYIFERNIRTATVLGIVGAGGIGMELKGRWDLFDYSHVSTVLLMIFLTVIALEGISQKIRSRTM